MMYDLLLNDAIWSLQSWSLWSILVNVRIPKGSCQRVAMQLMKHKNEKKRNQTQNADTAVQHTQSSKDDQDPILALQHQSLGEGELHQTAET